VRPRGDPARRALVRWAATELVEPAFGSPVLTRRELLAAGAGALGLLLAACSSTAHETVRRAAACTPGHPGLSGIDHVVIVMQENRSFDHYFGTYRGVRGFDDHPAGSLGPFAQPWPANTTRPPLGKLLPWHLDTKQTHAECIPDLTHNWGPQHHCWNHGRMDGFVTTHVAIEGPERGLTTMGYYTRADLPFYYALADAFTICDGYHCSVLGPTDPNRLMAMSAFIGQDGSGGGPVVHTESLTSSPTVVFTKTWTSMPERLQAAGISWKVYNSPGTPSTGSEALAISNNVLSYFKAYADPASELHRLAFDSYWPTDFVRDVATGNLPQVSWVLAPLLPYEEDEHPSAAPALGELFVQQVLNVLAAHPRVWSRTVMFLTYDENDGLFDHVAPPVPEPGTPGEWLTVDPLPADAEGIAGPIGLGIRVPMLVVSPFSRGGYVDSTTYDHTSMLRFLETRFGVEVPNLSAWRRSVTGDLTAAIGVPADPAIPPLPATGAGSGLPTSGAPPTVPAVVTRECPSSQADVLLGLAPAVPLPPVQRMPTQEPGRPRRRSC
jgi:phospholipase C